MSGIGFLGAGVIFKEGLNVRGLNTAATLWCSAAVGLLAGEGMALYGLMAAVLVIGGQCRLAAARPRHQPPADGNDGGRAALCHLDRMPAGARVRYPRSARRRTSGPCRSSISANWTALSSGETGRVEVTATVTSHKRRELALEAIVGRFADMEGVIRASWRLNPQGS